MFCRALHVYILVQTSLHKECVYNCHVEISGEAEKSAVSNATMYCLLLYYFLDSACIKDCK